MSEFLSLARLLLSAGLAAAAAVASPAPQGHPRPSNVPFELAPDLCVVGATVHTADPERPVATAFAVKAGRFVAVGDDARIRSLAGAPTRVIDLGGATVVPGFLDAHCHPSPLFPSGSPHAVVELGPEHVEDIDALVAALAAQADVVPAGGWVVGRGYQDTRLGRHPTRDDLDRATTRHHVRITHSSGHVTAFNSKALDDAGVTADTPDPAGGAFDRDADGRPNGVARETAAGVVTRALPRPAQPTEDEKLAGLLHRFDVDYLANGITGVGPAGIAISTFHRYQRAVRAGLKVRVNAMISLSYLDELLDMGITAGFGNDRLRIGGVKIYHGNSLSGRTCWLYEPYAHDPDYFGIPPARSQADLDALVLRIHEAGQRVCVHANGDREIDMVLDAIERALAAHPRDDHRHRIEHGSVANERILERMKALGVVLAPHSYVWEHGDKMEDYGAARWDWMHANRSALDMGIPVAGNSDAPVSAPRPLLRIQSLMTRRCHNGKDYGARQRLTFAQALHTWTLGSAFASFEEDDKGSITPGKLADFVVLEADPAATAPEQIGAIAVRSTWIDGERVWPRSERAANRR